MSTYPNIAFLLDTLRAIGQEGLNYSQNDYDTARYEKLLELAGQGYAQITGLTQAEVREQFHREQGSITPKLGVDAAIMNHDGAVLVLQRDDGTWGMPGGWADVGESPFQTARRETLEETGLSVVPIGYVGISHKSPLTHPGEVFVSQVNMCVAVERIPMSQKVTLSHEHTAYQWIHNAEEIDNWHPGHRRMIPRIFAAYEDGSIIAEIT